MTDSLLDIWKLQKRGRRDSMRHSERIKKAIKENLRDLISDISIISSDGKKKTKIPIRFLDSYRFKHFDDKNQEGVGQGNKDGKPGDILGHDGTGKEKGNQAGDQPGEDIYEEEIEIAEIINMMLEDLGLPWLENKDNVVEVETENIVFTDLAEVGPLSNVDRKRTIYENVKRNARKGEVKLKNIIPDDLRYRIWDIEKEYHSNAAVYFLMDRSGSMDDDKKYIAKSIFFYIAHFCRAKYKNVEIVFIAHDMSAKIVPEDDFFTITNSGGTMCSSAFELALQNIRENHPSNAWNTYLIEISDGDNIPENNKKCVKAVNELLEICNAVGYCEIDTNSIFYGGKFFGWSTLHEEFEKEIDHPHFISTKIQKKEEIYDVLKKFLQVSE